MTLCFCFWLILRNIMSSKSIHFNTSDKILLFLGLNNIALYTHTHHLSCFHFLITALWIAQMLCVYMCKRAISDSCDMSFRFWETSLLFSLTAMLIYISIISVRGFLSFYIFSKHLVPFTFRIITLLIGGRS